MRSILILVATAIASCVYSQVAIAFIDEPSTNSANENSSAIPDFKILTRIYVEKNDEPVSVNQTLFQDKLVFDFSSHRVDAEPSKIAIYDSRNRKFVLLDLQRQVKLKLDSLQLMRIFDGMKSDLEANERTTHLVSSEMKEAFDINKMELAVENDFAKYHLQGFRPTNDAILPLYHEFLDQYTFLSATDPSRTPPVARIQLNRAIKKYGLMPKQITRQVKANQFQTGNLQASTVSSKHQLVMSLNQTDEAKIELAITNWMQFNEVSLPEYYQIKTAVADSVEQHQLKR